MYENHSQGDIPINKNENHGCQASVGNGGKCGETKTLEILKEFQQLYESKLSEIKEDCSCTSTRLKVQMLEDWVKDLTEQNTMLVQVVEELEHEASERVSLLEDKLRHSSKTSFELMKTLQAYDAQNITNQSDAFQRLMYFQSDVNNLTEFIRRIREEGTWSTEGLHFYSVAQDDLCDIIPKTSRNIGKLKELEDSLVKLKMELAKSKQRQDEYELETRRKELLIREQTEQIEKLNEVVERCANSVPDRQKLLEELHDVRNQLKSKNEDYSRLELFDMDTKEKEAEDMRNKVVQLQEENENLLKTISTANEELNVLHELIKKYNKEQKETVNNLRNKFNIPSGDNMLVLHEAANKSTFLSDSDNEFHKTISILKADISKMILWKSENELSELKNHVSSIESTLYDIQSKDKLIKTKDEMIAVQNDTLNIAQKELKELREQLTDIEKDRDTKIQEIQNLQQALKMNQNTIEELEKALKNADDKANNIQQTADLYVETINLLENAKNKSETEVEQQRITIGNLQEALVNVKKQLEGVQGHNAAEVSVSSGWTSRWTGGGSTSNAKSPLHRSVHDI